MDLEYRREVQSSNDCLCVYQCTITIAFINQEDIRYSGAKSDGQLRSFPVVLIFQRTHAMPTEYT